MIPSHRARRAGAALVGTAALVAGVAACGDDADDSPDESQVQVGDADLGDLDIEVPDGWVAVPVNRLGFGFALPGDWESVVLDETGVGLLGQASPEVPGFVVAALSAHEAGALFYAAGVADDGTVDDLKVRADTDSGVEDADGLLAYAETVLEDGLDEPEQADVTVVEDAPHPTVDARYRAERPDPHGELGDGEDGADESLSEGIERFVLAPTGVVYMFLVTGETAEAVDDVGPEILSTLAFSGPSSD